MSTTQLRKISAIAKHLTGHETVLQVPIKVSSTSMPNRCHLNVMEQIIAYGGHAAYGYSVGRIGNTNMYDVEYHSNWVHNGKVIDVSPHLEPCYAGRDFDYFIPLYEKYWDGSVMLKQLKVSANKVKIMTNNGENLLVGFGSETFKSISKFLKLHKSMEKYT